MLAVGVHRDQLGRIQLHRLGEACPEGGPFAPVPWKVDEDGAVGERDRLRPVGGAVAHHDDLNRHAEEARRDAREKGPEPVRLIEGGDDHRDHARTSLAARPGRRFAAILALLDPTAPGSEAGEQA